MGKHGDPGKLNSWASSLSSASSSLDATVADLKAASPYALGDPTFHNVRVTAGTTQVTVGHYSGYMGNPGAPIHKTETKWVTEKALNQAGVAQNSGPFMTWLAGTVPSFGSTEKTWQGYAASMFSALLQDFVNTIEEIKTTIDQLSKTLSSIANSITQSRKWWRILLEVILPIIAILVVAVVNFFVPGLGAAILGFISNGLRFLGSIVGIVGESAVDVSAIDAVEVASTITEEAPALTETSTISDIASVLDIPQTLDLNPLQILSKIPGFVPGLGNTDIIAFPVILGSDSAEAADVAEVTGALEELTIAEPAVTTTTAEPAVVDMGTHIITVEGNTVTMTVDIPVVVEAEGMTYLETAEQTILDRIYFLANMVPREILPADMPTDLNWIIEMYREAWVALGRTVEVTYDAEGNAYLTFSLSGSASGTPAAVPATAEGSVWSGGSYAEDIALAQVDQHILEWLDSAFP